MLFYSSFVIKSYANVDVVELHNMKFPRDLYIVNHENLLSGKPNVDSSSLAVLYPLTIDEFKEKYYRKKVSSSLYLLALGPRDQI